MTRREILAIPLLALIPPEEPHPIFRKGFMAWSGVDELDVWRCTEPGFPGKWEFLGRQGDPLLAAAGPSAVLSVPKYQMCFDASRWWMCIEAGWPGRWKLLNNSEERLRASMQRLILRTSENRDRYIHYINTHYNGEWI